ncbi:hypothetical protein INT45_006214 [Circinella minor]|uniref:Uncharacterized protein n=1 Tax=Circinella minor TaxID=1195481 RepID=A0A8H7RVS4_9FUNG|nr:hypothetical protein INT45_006214 [Circinella minor]
MSSKATQEYRTAFFTLISQLSTIEQKGKDFFDKIEKSPWIPYEPSVMQADYENLMTALKALETHAKACGLLSITGSSTEETDAATAQGRNLATRTQETTQAVDTFFQEKNRLLMNIRAAVNTTRHSS